MLPNNPSQKLKPITVTVKQALDLTGLGITTLYELMKSGDLEFTHEGRRRLILYRSLEKRFAPPAPEAPRHRGRPRKVANEGGRP
jgi:excisionase family DNA binding protein